MALIRSLHPISLRKRSLAIPRRRKKSIILPPSGNFPDYWGFPFDSSTIDTSGAYSFSGGNPTYVSGAINEGVDFNSPSKFYGIFLTNYPNFCRLNWNIPWAFTGWFNIPLTSNEIWSLFGINNGSMSGNTNRSYYWWVGANIQQFAVINNNNSLEIKNTGTLISLRNQWFFCSVRYDPANPKIITFKRNNEASISVTFTYDFRDSSYYDNTQTLYLNFDSRNEKLDQWVFWYGSVLTDQNLVDLYNGGSGMPLP